MASLPYDYNIFLGEIITVAIKCNKCKNFVFCDLSFTDNIEKNILKICCYKCINGEYNNMCNKILIKINK